MSPRRQSWRGTRRGEWLEAQEVRQGRTVLAVAVVALVLVTAVAFAVLAPEVREALR